MPSRPLLRLLCWLFPQTMAAHGEACQQPQCEQNTPIEKPAPGRISIEPAANLIIIRQAHADADDYWKLANRIHDALGAKTKIRNWLSGKGYHGLADQLCDELPE